MTNPFKPSSAAGVQHSPLSQKPQRHEASPPTGAALHGNEAEVRACVGEARACHPDCDDDAGDAAASCEPQRDGKQPDMTAATTDSTASPASSSAEAGSNGNAANPSSTTSTTSPVCTPAPRTTGAPAASARGSSAVRRRVSSAKRRSSQYSSARKRRAQGRALEAQLEPVVPAKHAREFQQFLQGIQINFLDNLSSRRRTTMMGVPAMLDAPTEPSELAMHGAALLPQLTQVKWSCDELTKVCVCVCFA